MSEKFLKRVNTIITSRVSIFFCYTLAACSILFFVLHYSIYMVQKEQKYGFGKTDFAVFYAAGGAITKAVSIDTKDLYNGDKMKVVVKSVRTHKGAYRYLYFPQATIFFAPLTLMDFESSVRVWEFLSAIMFVAAYYLGISFFDTKLYKIRYSLILFALTFSYTIYIVFRTGTIDPLIWILLLGATFYAYKKKQHLVALLASIAITLKVFPAIFMLYFLVKRHWKIFIMTLIWCIFWVVISLPFFHVSTYIYFIKNVLFELLEKGNTATVIPNTSLYGSFMYAVYKHVPLVQHFGEEGFLKIGRYTQIIATLISCAFLGYIFYKYKNDKNKLRYLFDYTLLILFFLICSRGVQFKYHIWFLPFIVYLLSRPFKKKYILGYAIGFIVMILTFFREKIFSDDFLFIFLRPETIGIILLFITVIVLSMRKLTKAEPIFAKK